jgi:hypothetical protein
LDEKAAYWKKGVDICTIEFLQVPISILAFLFETGDEDEQIYGPQLPSCR